MSMSDPNEPASRQGESKGTSDAGVDIENGVDENVDMFKDQSMPTSGLIPFGGSAGSEG